MSDHEKSVQPGIGRPFGSTTADAVVRTSPSLDADQFAIRVGEVGGKVCSGGNGVFIVNGDANTLGAVSRLPGVFDVSRPSPLQMRRRNLGG